MKRMLILFIAIASSTSSVALATQAGDIWVSGYECSAGAGLTATCAGNSGSNSLYVTVSSQSDILEPVSVEAVVAVAAPAATLPDWWRMMAGGCRDGALSLDLGTAGTFSCGSPFEGTSPTSELEMCVGCGPTPLPNVAYIRARADASGMYPIEHYGPMTMMRLVIDRSRTVGTDACAGCQQPLCLALMSLRVVDSQGVTHEYCGPGPMASWQGGGPGCTYATIPPSPWSSCVYSVVGAEHRTWGSLKALYR